MSMDPGTMSQILAQRLQQPNGGGAPQMQSQTNAGQVISQVLQQALLAKAQQNQKAGNAGPLQTWATNQQMAAANAQMANDPSMQAMQQSPQGVLTPDQLQALQQPAMLPPSDPTGGAGG